MCFSNCACTLWLKSHKKHSSLSHFQDVVSSKSQLLDEGGSRAPTWFSRRVVTWLTVHIICSIQILTACCFFNKHRFMCSEWSVQGFSMRLHCLQPRFSPRSGNRSPTSTRKKNKKPCNTTVFQYGSLSYVYYCLPAW